MTTYRVEPVGMDVGEVCDLLALAVGGSDPDRLGRARARYSAGSAELAAAFAEGSPVGVLGYCQTTERGAPGRTTLLHIATHSNWRRKGVGAAMIEWVRGQHPGDSIEAQTDRDAVGFYRSIGFAIESLGERYPGVERFRVVLRSHPAARRDSITLVE